MNKNLLVLMGIIIEAAPETNMIRKIHFDKSRR